MLYLDIWPRLSAFWNVIGFDGSLLSYMFCDSPSFPIHFGHFVHMVRSDDSFLDLLSVCLMIYHEVGLVWMSSRLPLVFVNPFELPICARTPFHIYLRHLVHIVQFDDSF